MALLSEQDRQTVRDRLAVLERPVTLLLFTQTIDAPETALLTRQVLDEVASLNDHVNVEEINFILERERASAYGIEDIPAVVVLADGEDTRIRFLGAPTGYEFMSLIDAVALAGVDDSGLDDSSRALISEHATAPLDIQVFVTPT